jgi:hypothetical protein
VIDEERFRTASDFREIWERDFPMDSLSARRRNEKWGWLNQEFFRVNYLKQIKVRDFSEVLPITQTYFMRICCGISYSFTSQDDHIIFLEHESGEEKCLINGQSSSIVNEIVIITVGFTLMIFRIRDIVLISMLGI